MEERFYIWLNETVRLPGVKTGRLLAAFGSPSAVYGATESALSRACPLTPPELARLDKKSLRLADKILEECRKYKFGILTIDRPEYPELLRSIYDPPTVLYVRGRLPDLNATPCVAVVGKRKASPYGIIAAEKMGFGLSSAGVIVVSGMAEGADAAAHRGALRGGSPTVAVWGTAIDKCYPVFHVPLMREIEQNGAILSEYPPGAVYHKNNFPRRNRIIAGLCLGTVITEAGAQSGALITARLALDEGRDVFAIPGNIDQPASQGTNDLIAQSCARLVTGPQDVLDEYAALYAGRLQAIRPMTAPPARRAQEEPIAAAFAAVSAQRAPASTVEDATLSSQEERILSALTGPLDVDTLSAKTGIGTAQLLGALTMLELRGAIRQLAGKRFERI